MWLVAQSSDGLITVPFEYVAILVGILFTGGILYLAHRFLDRGER